MVTGNHREQIGHSSSAALSRPFVNSTNSFPAATHSPHLRRLFLSHHCLPLKDSLGSSLSHAPQIFILCVFAGGARCSTSNGGGEIDHG